MTHEARRQLIDSALWWTEHRSPEQAIAWLDGFEASIASLADNPLRCSLARESPNLPFALRQLLFGVSRRITHRAWFRLKGDEVEVLAIRHIAQRDVTRKDLA